MIMRVPAQARSSRAREKMPARPSTSSSTSSLTAWLTKAGPTTRPSPPVGQLAAHESYTGDADEVWINNDYTEDADMVNVGKQDKAAQLVAAVMLSLREQDQRDNTRDDIDRLLAPISRLTSHAIQVMPLFLPPSHLHSLQARPYAPLSRLGDLLNTAVPEIVLYSSNDHSPETIIST